MPPPNANNNGRVTNAILATKLDAQTDLLKRAINKQDEHDEEITALKVEQGKLAERLKFRTIAHSIVEAGTAVLSIVGLANQ